MLLQAEDQFATLYLFGKKYNWTKCDIRGTPALHLNEPTGGSCCSPNLGLVWHCYCIFFTFVCLIQKKLIHFGFLRGRGCVESKNKISAKRKSTMSSLNPSIIQLGSFKCRAHSNYSNMILRHEYTWKLSDTLLQISRIFKIGQPHQQLWLFW